MEEPSVGSLAEVFKCFICMGTLKDTHLCPRCSKPCCYSCIRRWLTTQKSQCPHCRETLYLYELVNCRWVKDVTQQLDTLQLVEDNAKKELCKTHNEKLTIFCLYCKQCICHQCALWDSNHSNHVFKPVEEIYLEHTVKINDELFRLRERSSELKSVMERIEKSISDVKNAKNERVDEIMHSTTQMISRLEQQLKKRLSVLLSQKNVWAYEYSAIELILKNAEHQIKTCSKSELLLTSKEIMQSIAEFKNKPINKLQNLDAALDAEFPIEVTPSYEGNVFVIFNFSLLRLSANPVYSKPLRVSGLTWRLKVFPAGTVTERDKYLAVFLELVSGFPETSKYQYRVEMVPKEDTSNVYVREFTSDFDVGECWGFNRFYHLDSLYVDGYLKAGNDTLVLDFRVRPLSYYQKCRDQSWYINQLQASQDEHIKQIDDLKQQLTESSKKLGCRKF